MNKFCREFVLKNEEFTDSEEMSYCCRFWPFEGCFCETNGTFRPGYCCSVWWPHSGTLTSFAPSSFMMRIMFYFIRFLIFLSIYILTGKMPQGTFWLWGSLDFQPSHFWQQLLHVINTFTWQLCFLNIYQ